MKKKILLTTLLLTVSVITIPLQVSASANDNPPVILQADNNNEISINTSDIIEYKYRVNSQGQLQYRRWNATKGYWIDATWLNAN